MRSQVEQCALLDRLAYSDGIDEPVRKVGLTGAAVTGIRAADKHAHRIEQKSKEKSQQCKYYGTTNHFFNHPPSTTRLSGRWGPENRENQREIGKLGITRCRRPSAALAEARTSPERLGYGFEQGVRRLKGIFAWSGARSPERRFGGAARRPPIRPNRGELRRSPGP